MIGDVTEAGIPEAGGKLSGEATRNAAIKRMKALQESSNYNPRKHQGTIGPPAGGRVGLPPSK